jgi:4-amino-4-deoxy-L-arabinose transferase-like glycosyltransferase
MNTTAVRRLVFAAIFLASFGIYVMRASVSGALREPPETGDGHDYDAIAFNVWQGRGFGYQWSDEAWRKPYEGIPRYRLLLTRTSDFYPTTYRPPAMPYLLSVVYALAGRNFTAWRVVNCAITAGAVTIAAIISAHFAGIPAALIAAGILLQSRELTRYSGMFMTEPLATLMLALLTWTFVRNAKDGWTVRRAVISGVAMGALLAARTIFILTMPILAILPGKDLSFGSRLAWKTKAVCLVVAIGVISPWWIRNIVVLDAFMPLGTQGGINLPMGFGPRALRHQGIWASNPGDGWPEIAALKLDIVTSEVMLAKHRQRLTLTWMMENPAQVLYLMRLHVTQELKPGRDFYSRWLMPAAAIAAVILWKFPAAWVLVLIVCANILSIAMTYSAGGRFMVPVQPLLAALIGGALVYGSRQALTLVRITSAATPRASA